LCNRQLHIQGEEREETEKEKVGVPKPTTMQTKKKGGGTPTSGFHYSYVRGGGSKKQKDKGYKGYPGSGTIDDATQKTQERRLSYPNTDIKRI